MWCNHNNYTTSLAVSRNKLLDLRCNTKVESQQEKDGEGSDDSDGSHDGDMLSPDDRYYHKYPPPPSGAYPNIRNVLASAAKVVGHSLLFFLFQFATVTVA